MCVERWKNYLSACLIIIAWKISYIWPWMVAMENPVGETLLQQNFCIHSVFIIVIFNVTHFCVRVCVFFFGLGVNKINTSSSFIKLDYQLITKDTTPTKWKRSIGQGVWKRVQSFHALSGDATLLVTLLPPCVHQLEALSVLLLKFLFFYVSVWSMR